MSASQKLHINKEWCKGCGICVEFCPKDVLQLKDGKIDIKDLDKCIQCKQCEILCPDFAIFLGGDEE